MVPTLYLAFPVLSLAAFLWLPARTAVGLVYLVGLVWLPPANYPPSVPAQFPYWIVGSLVPSDLLIAKAWLAPLVALVGSLVFAPGNWQTFRLQRIDLPVAGLCLWPLIQSLFVWGADPAGWLSSLYLVGVWGIPWLLGRCYFREASDIWHLLQLLIGVMLSLLPIALWEGVAGPHLYGALVQTHPFVADGASRYIGSRPIALFEHGNQYGIWICAAAFAGWALVRKYAGDPASEKWIILASVATLLAVAAQSVGALILLCCAIGLYFSGAMRRLLLRAVVPLLAVAVLLGGVYASGLLPIRAWAEQSAIGRTSLDLVRSTGRGSFAWRVSQDQRVVPLIAKAPIMGAGHWDWWRPAKTRPWGSAMLILGQFGIVGLLLVLATLCGPVMQSIMARIRDKELRWARRVLSLLIFMGLADALLNSFVFLPAIAMAGAIAGKPPRKATSRRAVQPSAND